MSSGGRGLATPRRGGLGWGFGSQALQRLPVPPLRAEPAYWATVREVRGQATLVGWDGELAELAAFSIGSEGYLQLTGEAWVGKTTLVAEFVLSGLPPGVDAVAYHLVRAEAEATAEKFLSAVVPQLAYLLGLPATPTDTHTFRHYWEQAVERAEREKRHLLLVVDGLDEDLQPAGPRSSVARLLPRRVGGRAHVLVTTRSGVPLPAVSDHPLGAARQLPLIGHPDAELARVRAQQELDDLLRDADELEAKVVGTLAAAAGPLTIEDLLALLPGTRSLALTRTLTERAARTMSMPGKPGRASYRFAHQSLLMQARSTMELEVPQLREEIHKWADGWRSRHWRDDDGTPVPAYLLESYPDTLVPGSGQDGDLGRLAALTSDVGWVAAAVRASGVDRVLGTLRTATSVLPDGRLPESDNGEMTTARLPARCTPSRMRCARPGPRRTRASCCGNCACTAGRRRRGIGSRVHRPAARATAAAIGADVDNHVQGPPADPAIRPDRQCVSERRRQSHSGRAGS